MRNPHFALSIDPAEAGALLATLSDLEQANFFQQFAIELRKVCITEYRAGMQMRAIQGHLGTPAQELYLHMVPEDK